MFSEISKGNRKITLRFFTLKLNCGTGLNAAFSTRVAFFAALESTYGVGVPTQTDLAFSTVVTNVGKAYNATSGRFTAPVNGVYKFSVTIAAQGRFKVFSNFTISQFSTCISIMDYVYQ